MANTKISALTADTAPTADDLVVTVNDPGGTPATKKATITNFTKAIPAVVGDSGSGGTKGLVPAPGAGDAAAGKFLKADGTFAVPSGTGAPSDATYITQTANGSLSNEQALSSLSTGLMRVATTTGVITSITDSAGLAANISDETGSGALVFATSPTLVTPALGTPSSGTLTSCTIKCVIAVAVSDETTAITTGTAKVTFRMPHAMTLTEVRASLSASSSSGNPAIDVNEGGVSIFSTTLTIDSGEKTSTTAATPAVISDASLADDAEITIDIDTAGTGAKGLKVYLIGTRS